MRWKINETWVGRCFLKRKSLHRSLSARRGGRRIRLWGEGKRQDSTINSNLQTKVGPSTTWARRSQSRRSRGQFYSMRPPSRVLASLELSKEIEFRCPPSNSLSGSADFPRATPVERWRERERVWLPRNLRYVNRPRFNTSLFCYRRGWQSHLWKRVVLQRARFHIRCRLGVIDIFERPSFRAV